MDREQEIAVGIGAQQLLDNQYAQLTLTTLIERRVAEWRSSGPLDTERRERIWMSLRTIEQFIEELKSMSATANARRIQLEAENARRKREEESDKEVADRLGIPVEIVRRNRLSPD